MHAYKVWHYRPRHHDLAIKVYRDGHYDFLTAATLPALRRKLEAAENCGWSVTWN